MEPLFVAILRMGVEEIRRFPAYRFSLAAAGINFEARIGAPNIRKMDVGKLMLHPSFYLHVMKRDMVEWTSV